MTATWDPSPASDAVTAYETCVGTRSLACDTVRWTVDRLQQSFTFTPVRGVLHLVTVRAVSQAGAGPYAQEIAVSTPRLNAIADRSDPSGTAIAAALAISDPDGSGVTFSATNLPPGLTIDAGTGRLSGTPTTTGAYRPTVTVADAFGSDVQSFGWTITAPGSSGAGSAMSAISFSFSPAARQTVGAPVVVSASGQGGSAPTYRFWVQPWGGSWQIMQDWSAASNWTWRPLTVGGYNVTVDGRGRSTGDADVTSSATFEVVAAAATGGGSTGSTQPMTSVALSFTPTTPQAVGTAVTLTAQGQGGSGTPTYRFWVQRWGGSWEIVQDWSTATTHTWRPSTTGGYNLTVYGRNGPTGDGEVTTSRTFEATATAPAAPGGSTETTSMTSVTLSYSPATPQPTGTAVVLTAAGQGGSGVPMYSFLVQPWGGAWQVLQDWSTSNSVTWRPAAAGGYSLTVYGRNGTAGSGVSTSRTFEATASSGGGTTGTSPMTSVALSFTPTTPQPVGTSVTMSAQGQGGSGTAMYLFLVQPWGGAWQTVQDWSTSPTLTWRPWAAGGYNLTVYGRRGTTGNGDTSDSRTFEARQ